MIALPIESGFATIHIIWVRFSQGVLRKALKFRRWTESNNSQAGVPWTPYSRPTNSASMRGGNSAAIGKYCMQSCEINSNPPE
jgi:hypothetical protein